MKKPERVSESTFKGLVKPLLFCLLSITSIAVADTGHSHQTPAGEPGTTEAVGRTVEIIMRDNYFEPERLQIDAGTTVRFVIRNQGDLVHEFNIGTVAMHEEHQDEMARMIEQGAIRAGRIEQGMSHDHANSVLLEPGESGEILWKFTTSSTLEFACNIPGHYQSGMRGDIDVTQAGGDSHSNH
ncbi:MAG: cupredoxin family protein [Pseudohongiellaceae bacterium]